jgi:DNA-binding NarL/FixJ family response regulator
LLCAIPESGGFVERATPKLILFDEALNIVFAEPTALQCLNSEPPPEPLEQMLRRALRDSADKLEQEPLIRIRPNLLARICQLRGNSGAFIALFLEAESRRSDLPSAVRRYSLTRRETEVLTLILQGLNAGEIAKRLSIAENTVSDYFKILLRKTGARNRAEMVALVLGFEGNVSD